MTSSAKLRVDVSDVNDHVPTFSQARYSVDIVENKPPDILPIHVNASDPDQGDNARIEYSLSVADLSCFEINRFTGVISSRISFDRERMSRYRLTVYASDHGRPSLTGTVQVEINIVDVNDERPEFVSNSYLLSLKENQPAGTLAGAISVVDADSPPFNRFTLRILSKEALPMLSPSIRNLERW